MRFLFAVCQARAGGKELIDRAALHKQSAPSATSNALVIALSGT
jgi:hypothetical protein